MFDQVKSNIFSKGKEAKKDMKDKKKNKEKESDLEEHLLGDEDLEDPGPNSRELAMERAELQRLREELDARAANERRQYEELEEVPWCVKRFWRQWMLFTFFMMAMLWLFSK